MKRMSLLATQVLAIALLAACGEKSGVAAAPKDASVDEYCQPYRHQAVLLSKKKHLSDAKVVEIARHTAAKLQEVGTPSDMPGDARKGFEIVVQQLSELSDDATAGDVVQAQMVSDEELKYTAALGDYFLSTCGATARVRDGGQ